jgi:DNA-nicking Smr family endonuclease
VKRNGPRSASVEPEEKELLRAALADVQPLAPANRASLIRPKPDPVAAQRQRAAKQVPLGGAAKQVPLGGDEQEILGDTLSDSPAWQQGLENGEELLFRRDGLSQQHIRKLRRGHWKVQDHLDLHGLIATEARALTAAFLAHAIRNGLRCVRIVHGKGLSSPNREPVLKKKLSGWLAQRDEVLAYCQAPQPEGGGGAVLVLLRATK